MFVQRILQLELITKWMSCLPLRLHQWRKPTNVGKKKTDDERGRYYIDRTSRDIFECNRRAIKQREENQQKDIEHNRQKGESDKVLKQLSRDMKSMRDDMKALRQELKPSSSNSKMVSHFARKSQAANITPGDSNGQGQGEAIAPSTESSH